MHDSDIDAGSFIAFYLEIHRIVIDVLPVDRELMPFIALMTVLDFKVRNLP